MRTISLKSYKKDVQWLSSNLIDLQFIADFLTTILNQIRPSKKRVSYKLKLVVVDSEFSYYDFSDTLYIAREVEGFKKSEQKMRILEDLFHEFDHFIQYKIDRIAVNRFATDHEKISYTSYFKNKTEVQARIFSRFAKECLNTFIKIRKMKRHLLNLDEDKKRETTKS